MLALPAALFSSDASMSLVVVMAAAIPAGVLRNIFSGALHPLAGRSGCCTLTIMFFVAWGAFVQLFDAFSRSFLWPGVETQAH